jgi:hypothetical protein
MANEIRLRAQLSYAKSGRSGYADSGDIPFTMAGTHGLDTTQTVGTVEEALLLGEVLAASAHYYIENMDAANSVDLKPATGGTVTTTIGPGRVALGQFKSTVSAPFVQAIGAPVIIKILLVQA